MNWENLIKTELGEMQTSVTKTLHQYSNESDDYTIISIHEIPG